MEQWMIYYGIFQLIVIITSYFHLTGHKNLNYDTDNEIVPVILFTVIPGLNVMLLVLLWVIDNTTTIVGAKLFGKKLYNYLPFLPVLLLLLLFFI